MLRNALFATVIALGAASVAQAQDFGPRLIGSGENATVVYSTPSRNVVGGAVATLTGSSENAQLAYGPMPTVNAQTGLAAEMVGSGDNTQIVYHQVTPSGSMLAGQTARNGG